MELSTKQKSGNAGCVALCWNTAIFREAAPSTGKNPNCVQNTSEIVQCAETPEMKTSKVYTKYGIRNYTW